LTNDEWLVANRVISHVSMQPILPDPGFEDESGDHGRADPPALEAAPAGAKMSTT
jgi:hypothetical protein